MKTKAHATKIKRLQAWLMAGLTTGMMTSASAQSITTNNTTTVGPVTPLDCDRIYVDPVNGSNNGTGTFNNPLLRIQDAIWAATPPAVVVALPGVYSSSTNGESFPLWMREGISLQGNSAMDTILDGEGFSSEIIRFMPASSSDTFNNVLIDGVMITGGGIGVYMGDEFHPRPQFSNCFIVKNGVGVHIRALRLGYLPSFILVSLTTRYPITTSAFWMKATGYHGIQTLMAVEGKRACHCKLPDLSQWGH